jgi:hypothetical protein
MRSPSVMCGTCGMESMMIEKDVASMHREGRQSMSSSMTSKETPASSWRTTTLCAGWGGDDDLFVIQFPLVEG